MITSSIQVKNIGISVSGWWLIYLDFQTGCPAEKSGINCLPTGCEEEMG